MDPVVNPSILKQSSTGADYDPTRDLNLRFRDLISINQLSALLAKALEGGKVIITNVAVARYFGPETYGKYAFIIALVSLIAILAEFRLQNVLVNKLVQGGTEKQELIGSAIGVNFIFALIGFLILLIYNLFESDIVVSFGLTIYALSFFYKLPRSFRAYYVSTDNNHLIACCEFLSSIISISLVFLFIYGGLDIIWLIFARSLDFLVLGLLFSFAYPSRSGEQFPLRLSIRKDLMLCLVKESAPLVLSGAAMLLFQRIDLIMVRYFLGDEPAGFYGSAANLTLLFSLVPIVLSESLAPKMFRKRGCTNFRATQQQFSNIIIAVGILMSILMWGAGSTLVDLLYGAAFSEAKEVVLLFSICPLLTAFGAAAGQIIVSDGKQSKSFIKSVYACAIGIFLNIILIPLIGIFGAAWSTIVGLAVANLLAHRWMSVYRYIFGIQLTSIRNTLLFYKK